MGDVYEDEDYEDEETERIFFFRLPLNAKEFDRLNMCCQHVHTGPGAFLRMLLNKFWDEI